MQTAKRFWCSQCGKELTAAPGGRCPGHETAPRLPQGWFKRQFAALRQTVQTAAPAAPADVAGAFATVHKQLAQARGHYV